MGSLPISARKRLGESIKAGCRLLCRPLLPIVPDGIANRFPFLGHARVHGPHNLRFRMHTYGPQGKDRIAVKLARRGLGGYEGETTRLFLALSGDAGAIFDIGANTGLFALLAAGARPDCQVLAFEPVPFIHAMLQKNIDLNRLSNLEAVPVAFSDTIGEITFYITRTNVGIPTDSSSCAGFRGQVDEFHLPTITLDEFVSRRQIEKLDLIKIDAEGAESKVMRGALQTIERDRPWIIGEVLEDVDHSYVEQTLRALDYRFYHITPADLQPHDRLRGSLNVAQRNYLFAPAEKEARLAEICASGGITLGRKT